MISDIATSKGEDTLDGSDKKLYESAVKVLLNTLESANINAADIRDNLNTYSLQLITIQSTMKSVSSRLRLSAEGKSKEFTDWRDSTRAKVYGGCAASIVTGPGVVACYAIAAGVLESEIASYKNKVTAFVNDFTTWASTFDVLGDMAG
jgi:hypothetical protein